MGQNYTESKTEVTEVKGIFVLSLDKSWGYSCFISVDNFKNTFTDFIQTWSTHVFRSEEEPYFKVTLNSQ